MSSSQPVESLETRRLFATSTLGADGVLSIVLNPGADRVRILEHGAGSGVIDVIVRREAFQQFNGVTSVRVEGLTGNDVMYLGGTVSIPAVMIGGPGRDVLIGALGDDTLDGGVGNDFIDGGPGNDTIVGGIHDDIISGSAGNDTIDGGTGRDRIDGGVGDDVLTGGGGADAILGGEGNDRITGGIARDVLTGGAGADTFSATDRDREISDLTSEDTRG